MASQITCILCLLLLILGGLNYLSKPEESWSHYVGTLNSELTLQGKISGKRRNPTKPKPIHWNENPDKLDTRAYDLCLRTNSKLTTYTTCLSRSSQNITLHSSDAGYLKVMDVSIPFDQWINLKLRRTSQHLGFWMDNHFLFSLPLPNPMKDWALGVLHRGNSVRAVQVLSTQEPVPSPPNRVYQMTLRNWMGSLFVFSDDEPVARFDENLAELTEMRLRPGYKPQIHAALVGAQGGLIGSQLQSLKPVEGIKSEIAVAVRGYIKDPFVPINSFIRISYDGNKDSYTYDFESEIHILPELERPSTIYSNYLFPYHSSPNAGRSLPQSKLPYPWEVFRGMDGGLYKIPIRNDWDDRVPTSHRTRSYFGHSPFMPDMSQNTFRIRGPDPYSNPSVTFLSHESQGAKMATATCAFSHETFFGWIVGLDHHSRKNIKSHYRFHALQPKEMNSLMKRAKVPSFPFLARRRINHAPGIYDFRGRELNSVSEPTANSTWQGYYDVTLSEGVDDKSALSLPNRGWVKFRPVLEGNKFGYIPSPSYLLSFFAKGTSQVSVEFERGTKKESVALRINGNDRWKKYEIATPLFEKEEPASVTMTHSSEKPLLIDKLAFEPIISNPHP